MSRTLVLIFMLCLFSFAQSRKVHRKRKESPGDKFSVILFLTNSPQEVQASDEASDEGDDLNFKVQSKIKPCGRPHIKRTSNSSSSWTSCEKHLRACLLSLINWAHDKENIITGIVSLSTNIYTNKLSGETTILSRNHLNYNFYNFENNDLEEAATDSNLVDVVPNKQHKTLQCSNEEPLHQKLNEDIHTKKIETAKIEANVDDSAHKGAQVNNDVTISSEEHNENEQQIEHKPESGLDQENNDVSTSSNLENENIEATVTSNIKETELDTTEVPPSNNVEEANNIEKMPADTTEETSSSNVEDTVNSEATNEEETTPLNSEQESSTNSEAYQETEINSDIDDQPIMSTMPEPESSNEPINDASEANNNVIATQENQNEIETSSCDDAGSKTTKNPNCNEGTTCNDYCDQGEEDPNDPDNTESCDYGNNEASSETLDQTESNKETPCIDDNDLIDLQPTKITTTSKPTPSTENSCEEKIDDKSLFEDDSDSCENGMQAIMGKCKENEDDEDDKICDNKLKLLDSPIEDCTDDNDADNLVKKKKKKKRNKVAKSVPKEQGARNKRLNYDLPSLSPLAKFGITPVAFVYPTPIKFNNINKYSRFVNGGRYFGRRRDSKIVKNFPTNHARSLPFLSIRNILSVFDRSSSFNKVNRVRSLHVKQRKKSADDICKPSLVELLKPTLADIKRHAESFLLIVIGGELDDAKDEATDTGKAIKYLQSNLDKKRRTIVISQQCPKVDNPNAAIPLLAKGYKSEMFKSVETLCQIPSSIEKLIKLNNEKSKKRKKGIRH